MGLTKANIRTDLVINLHPRVLNPVNNTATGHNKARPARQALRCTVGEMFLCQSPIGFLSCAPALVERMNALGPCPWSIDISSIPPIRSVVVGLEHQRRFFNLVQSCCVSSAFRLQRTCALPSRGAVSLQLEGQLFWLLPPRQHWLGLCAFDRFSEWRYTTSLWTPFRNI